jgi:pimeloyl-ACP methyl ester carboxylesterase
MRLVDALKAQGIDAYCPQLPTSDLTRLNVGDVEHPDFDLGPPSEGYPQGEEDTEVILNALKPLVEEQGKRVVMLGHSAGGWAATQAAQKELQAKERAKQGLPGGIIGVLYVGAFVIPVGDSIHTFFQPKSGPAVVPPFLNFHVRRQYPCSHLPTDALTRNTAPTASEQSPTHPNFYSTTSTPRKRKNGLLH